MLSSVDGTEWILRGDVSSANHANVYRQLLQHADHFHVIDAQQTIAVYLQKSTISVSLARKRSGMSLSGFFNTIDL